MVNMMYNIIWINSSHLFITLGKKCWVCAILFACVCVGALGLTTASDDPSSSALCVMCAERFPREVLGGDKYAPPGYAQRLG